MASKPKKEPTGLVKTKGNDGEKATYKFVDRLRFDTIDLGKKLTP